MKGSELVGATCHSADNTPFVHQSPCCHEGSSFLQLSICEPSSYSSALTPCRRLLFPLPTRPTRATNHPRGILMVISSSMNASIFSFLIPADLGWPCSTSRESGSDVSDAPHWNVTSSRRRATSRFACAGRTRSVVSVSNT